jgi:hypothetical protein
VADEKTAKKHNIVIWQENLCAFANANFHHQPLKKAARKILPLQKNCQMKAGQINMFAWLSAKSPNT